MERISRDVRTCTIADLHERYVINGYANIELPKEVDKEKQDRLIKGILLNVPMPPIVLVCYYSSESFKLSYHVIQGKELLEMILDYIVKNEKKDTNLRYDLEGLTKQEKHDFWHYHVAQHYISTELSEEDRVEMERMYAEL